MIFSLNTTGRYPSKRRRCVFCEVQFDFFYIIEIGVRLDRFNMLYLNKQCLGVEFIYLDLDLRDYLNEQE